MLSYYYCSDYKLLFLSYWIQTTFSMSLMNNDQIFSISSNPDHHIRDFIVAKGYIPNEKDLPKPSIVKNVDNDVTYLLSKLSDEELLKLLSKQPNKNEYDVRDLMKITMNSKYPSNDNLNFGTEQTSSNKPLEQRPIANELFTLENLHKTRFQTVSEKSRPDGAFFRLEHKEVDPFASIKGSEKQAAVQKLNNLFYSRPSETDADTKNDDDDDVKKELLFDILVGQLKALCCKRSKSLKKNKPQQKLKSFLNDVMPKETSSKTQLPEIKATQITVPNEHMFLILNDEIKSYGNEEDGLISVDPESLGKNSSVMVLGPLSTPLSDTQLKVVMSRIANELSKPEYLPLLQQISDGMLSSENVGLANSLIRGTQTRRYIKPHRCNHQSVLARIYGGPKWLICTGYLNLNQPSLYD